MTFSYKSAPACLGATTLVLLLSSFSGISHNSLTTTHQVYSSLGPTPETVAWLNIPLPPPPEDRRPAGSRDGLLCLIPAGSNPENVSSLWSRRLTFVWAEKFLDPSIQSRVEQIVVVVPESKTVVWSQSVAASELLPKTDSSPWRLEQLAFDGPALQAGRDYQWFALDKRQRPLSSGRFQVMDLADQHAISQDLMTLNEAMVNQGATEEAIVMAKSFYFAERQLWPDAMQVALSIESPSPALGAFQSQLLEQICQET